MCFGGFVLSFFSIHFSTLRLFTPTLTHERVCDTMKQWQDMLSMYFSLRHCNSTRNFQSIMSVEKCKQLQDRRSLYIVCIAEISIYNPIIFLFDPLTKKIV